MYITNADEVIPLLRGRLREYLGARLGVRSNARKIQCFVHKDENPSMYFNPKTNDETVKCFSCGWSGDIFAAAAELEGLASSGPEWITQTIPHLCEKLNIKVKLGEPSAIDKEKIRLFKLCQDVSDILIQHSPEEIDYVKERNWEQDFLAIGSINEDTLMSKLAEKGWDPGEINQSLVVRTKYFSFFGEDRLTFVIKDHRGRPCGFITKPLQETEKGKYVNSSESSIYEKSKILLGLDVALVLAKKEGLHIVEGPGDLAQLYRLGIYNAAAVCGTAFTEHHLLLLKSLGIRRVFLNFDWDNAGYIATQRVLENVLQATSGIATCVTAPPSESFEEYNTYPKDPDEYLRQSKTSEDYLSLKKATAFEWQLTQASENDPPDVICRRMIPIIAAEDAAVKRELLIKALSDFTGLSGLAISTDVSSLRNKEFSKRKECLITSAEQYLQTVSEDPDNIMAHVAQHERQIDKVEKEFSRNTLGINYQLARYETIQEIRMNCSSEENMSTFKMNFFPMFADALAGGMNWASGCLMYVGGRANSGKTATVLALGCDVALSDPNTTVIIHSTDDSYEQIEPRIKSNVYYMSHPTGLLLTMGMVVQPHLYIDSGSEEQNRAYEIANEVVKDLLNEERLVIIDAEDGSTLTVLERNLRFYRRRYPGRKILVICDNTHNYMDFTNLDQTTRMTMISNQQKTLVAKYHACMIATAEYRKNMPMDTSKLKLPVDDDLADARSLMYRPNVIFHVYNDLHDRKEHAEIFWTDKHGKASPRLLLNFTKNKVSGFKEKIILDLDPSNVTLRPRCAKRSLEEAESFRSLKDQGSVKLQNNSVIRIKATEYEEEYDV